MELNQYSSIFWDFGGVITSSPFEAFNKFEIENNLPVNFLRKVNSTNPQNNAWALLEQSKINQMEFNELFFKESSELGYGVEGLKVLNLFSSKLSISFSLIIPLSQIIFILFLIKSAQNPEKSIKIDIFI